MPWHLLMFIGLDTLLPDSDLAYSMIIEVVFIGFSALLNIIILYFLGFLLSLAYERFNKTYKMFDD